MTEFMKLQNQQMDLKSRLELVIIGNCSVEDLKAAQNADADKFCWALRGSC